MPELNPEIPRSDDVHLLGLVEDVGKVALSAVLAVVHSGHEDTGTTLKIATLDKIPDKKSDRD